MADREALYQRFYALVDSIPCGNVATYGQIAREAGAPRHARAVGRALRLLSAGSPLPWHRVLNARGGISERPGGSTALQARRLRSEGISVDRRGVVDLDRYRWEPSW